MTVAQAAKNLRVRFGRADTQVSTVSAGLILDLCVPALDGPAEEWHGAPADAEFIADEGLHLLRGPDGVAGVAVQPSTAATLETDSLSVYQRVLKAVGSQHLYRVWNYVPHINAITGGLENYHRFNIGRWRAFSHKFGESLHQMMPAASAVGIQDDVLVTVFVAGTDPVRYVENPRQVPAWNYPEQYGPKSPSFSRGARRETPRGPQAFVSGTASIRGHQTVGQGDLAIQCAVTCENLQLVFSAMELPDPFGADALPCQTKVYVRNAADVAAARALFQQHAGAAPGSNATYLQAEICRPDLDLEVEITTLA